MEKVLIIRMSAVGDIVMATPIIDVIRASYPNASISWLVQPHFSAPIKDHPAIDHVIEWDHRQWSTLWKVRKFSELARSVKAFRQQLRSHKFDTVLDMQGLLKSGIPAWFTGAKNRIGLGSKEGSNVFMHQVIARDAGDVQKIGSEYRYLAEELGLDTSEWAMRLETSNQTKEEAAEIIKQQVGSQPYMTFCPFTTRPQKHWFDDAWRELAMLLEERFKYPILMLGGPGDKAAAKALAEGSNMINLAGKTSLQAASELIRQSQLLVGVDTGLTHMGHAHQIPTVALFGSTCPYLETDNPDGKVIYHDLSCSPCRRSPSCEGRFDCLREITPSEVMREITLLVNDS